MIQNCHCVPCLTRDLPQSPQQRGLVIPNTVRNLIPFLLFILCCLTACEKSPDANIPAKGYLEYQYSYFIDGETDADGNPVYRYAYERVTINSAFFALRNDLSEAQQAAGIRGVNIYVHSDGYTGQNASSLGGSYIKIQLLDTLGRDADQNKLLPFSYNIGVASSLKPVHSGFEGRMILEQDNSVFSFKREILGNELTTNRIYLFHLGNGQYEILVNGLYNDRTYSFHYAGPIQLQHDIPDWDITR